MKKAWPYISFVLLGVIIGIITAVKWLIPDKVIINVKKQRIWGRDNRMNVDVPVNVDTSKTGKKPTLSERLQARRDRIREKKLQKSVSDSK